MRQAAIIAVFLSLVLLPVAPSAQQMGDKIVVTTDNAPLRSQDAATGTVPKGNILTVNNVNGDRLWVIYWGEKGTVKGWISRSDVIPFSQALDFFNQELKRNPTATAYDIRGMIWNATKEYDKAIADYDEAIRLDPKYALPYVNRGTAWMVKCEFDNAIADYNEAIHLNPTNAKPWNNRGGAWYAQGDYDKAIADFNEAIRLFPNLALAYRNRGDGWDAKGEYNKAIADYGEAIRLDPKDHRSLKNRAWIAATCPDAKYRDGKKAVDDATKACELDGWKVAGDLDTLAAAYAEAGDFDSALKWEMKGRDMVSESEKADYQSRLDVYKAHKPYREKPKK